VQIPERRIYVMTVADKRYDGYAEHFAQSAERFGQDRGRAAERISRLGVYDRYIAVFGDFFELSYKRYVVCEFALTDTAYVAQKFFSADKSVYGDDVVGARREYRLRGDLEIKERVVIA
jgi:hypothetical protein